jgi:hypothetical protein
VRSPRNAESGPGNTTAWLDWEGIARDPLARAELWAMLTALPQPVDVKRVLLPAIILAAGDPASPFHRYYRFRSVA